MLRLKKESKPNHKLAYKMLSQSLANGIQISDELHNMIRAYNEKYYRLADTLERKYGITNVDSSEQVKQKVIRVIRQMYDAEEIFETCKVNGRLVFNSDNLRYVYQNYKIEVCKLITETRAIKRTITQLTSLMEMAYKDSRHRVYPSLSRSQSNRFSYAQPAIMSIPKQILWDVVVPRKAGAKLYSIDIKYQEPLTVVNMLNIEVLKGLVADGEDLYKAIYKMIFGKDCETEEERKDIKLVWNAMTYGATKRNIDKHCKVIDGLKVYEYFKSIPEYQAYHKMVKDLIKAGNYEIESYFGVPLKLSEKVLESNTSKKVRSLADLKIQGTCSDILAFLLGQLNVLNDNYGTHGLIQLYFTRHDELIIEVDKALKDNQMEEIFKDYFTHQVEGWLPFNVEVTCISEGRDYSLDELDEVDDLEGYY